MAKEATTTAAAEPKVRKPRTPSQPKAVYAVVQILNEDGTPNTSVGKAHVKVLSFEKSAEKVLEIVESGRHPGALFLRGMLPAGR